MTVGDPLWFRASSYGYGYKSCNIPVVFLRMSESGRRALVRILGPDGVMRQSIFVHPDRLSKRDQHD